MRGEIPRSPRTLRKRGQQTTAGIKSTWLDKVLKTGPFVVSLTGLFVSIAAMLVTMTVSGPTLVRNGKDFVTWYRTDQALSGHWNNSQEGDVEPPTWETSEDDAVFLNINAYQGQISGTAVSQRLCRYILHSDILVEGRVAGNDGEAVFWDLIGGERRAFAKAKLHIDRANRLLDFNVVEQAPGLFPETFRLRKEADDVSSESDRDHSEDESEKLALKQAKETEQARYRGSFCRNALERIEQAGRPAKK